MAASGPGSAILKSSTSERRPEETRSMSPRGFHAPVSRLEAGTGEVLHAYEDTAFADEILAHDGVLFVTVDRAAQWAKRYVGL
jgi:hypothetical protein